MLPGPVRLQLLAFEVAHVDVVEERLLDERDVLATGQRDLGRLPRAREARVEAGIERELRQLVPESARLLPTLLGEGDRDRRIAVDAPLDVQGRLAVTCEYEYAQSLHHEALVPLAAAGEAVERERRQV